MATEEATSYFGSPLTPGTPETSFIFTEHSKIFSEINLHPLTLHRNASECSSDGLLENVMEDYRYPWTFHNADSRNGSANGSYIASSSVNTAPDVVDSRDTNGNSAKDGTNGIPSMAEQVVAPTEPNLNPLGKVSNPTYCRLSLYINNFDYMNAIDGRVNLCSSIYGWSTSSPSISDGHRTETVSRSTNLTTQYCIHRHVLSCWAPLHQGYASIRAVPLLIYFRASGTDLH